MQIGKSIASAELLRFPFDSLEQDHKDTHFDIYARKFLQTLLQNDLIKYSLRDFFKRKQFIHKLLFQLINKV